MGKNFAIIYGINRTKFLHILRSLINQFKKINVSIGKKIRTMAKNRQFTEI